MIKKCFTIFTVCILSLGLFAQEEKSKPKKSKVKAPKENICVPEQKPDTTIDLKTGKPKTAVTDTTINNKQ
jgi:hypothetical protein